MNLADFREAYYEASAKASDLVRQLSFAGIAIVWLFSVVGERQYHVPDSLRLPLLLLVGALALGFLQTVYRALAWGIFSRFHERRGVTPEQALDAPAWINWLALTFFWSKVILLALGYGVLLAFLWNTL